MRWTAASSATPWRWASPSCVRRSQAPTRTEHGLVVDPDDVVITTGSSGGFLLAFLACFDVGDRVAIASPGYPCYRNILSALGGEVVEMACGPGDDGSSRRPRCSPTLDRAGCRAWSSPAPPTRPGR